MAMLNLGQGCQVLKYVCTNFDLTKNSQIDLIADIMAAYGEYKMKYMNHASCL